jgi:hypothetical protein
MWVCDSNSIQTTTANVLSLLTYVSSNSSVGFSKPSHFSMALNDIKFCGTVYRLTSPITISLYVQDGIWTCEQETFSSLSYGPTPEEAVHAFCEDFSVLWHEIAEAADDELTQDAQRVKSALLSAVALVQGDSAKCR